MVRAASDQDTLRLLTEGELEILGLLPRSSNYTFLARVSDGDEHTLVVYKPRAGEMPLWDFREGTLCRREVAAHVLARELGWPWVPFTVLRDGPEGPGSVQLYVDFDPRQHYFTMAERRADDFRRIALFDALANNADRKSGHCLLSRDGRLFVIDHGVCFGAAPKLRTVIWEFAGEPIPGGLLADVGRVAGALRTGSLRAELRELIDGTELRALESRAGSLLRACRYPHPAGGRPYPWPAV